jgi:hypothetical protein
MNVSFNINKVVGSLVVLFGLGSLGFGLYEFLTLTKPLCDAVCQIPNPMIFTMALFTKYSAITNLLLAAVLTATGFIVARD